MTTTTDTPFTTRTRETLTTLETSGQMKILQTLDSPMDAVVTMVDADGSRHERICMCSNNYLGLANHPAVVDAGIEALKKYGAGTASVRFICGTFTPHHTLEKTIATYMGTEAAYTFVSCWNATEALFPTVCEPGDIIISDELNHACIVDSMRLTTAIKKGVKKAIYKHADMDSVREVLEKAKNNPEITGQIWLITDGVFSMEGDIADLPALRTLCDQYNALLVVDDSHGHGVMGKTGRGTHEHHGMCPPYSDSFASPGLPGEVAAKQTEGVFDPALGTADIFTGTLGKALGGGAGGFVAASQQLIDLIIQRGRPTLFSNALPVTVAASANAAIQTLMAEPQRVEKLRDITKYCREQIKAKTDFDVLDSPTAICPIIVGPTEKAIAMSKQLLQHNIFVIGFGYPVVPEGEARLRIQMSASHTREHVDQLVEALRKL